MWPVVAFGGGACGALCLSRPELPRNSVIGLTASRPRGLTAYVSGRVFYSHFVGDIGIGNIREQRHMRLAEAYLDCTGVPDAEADVASVAAWIGLIETIARIPAVVFELRPAYTLTVTEAPSSV